MGTSAPKPVVDSVEGVGRQARFQDNGARDRKVFLSPGCKGEQLRSTFPNYLSVRRVAFDARTCLTPVIHEESIKACPEFRRRGPGATKAPDYTFRSGGRRVFFAEAKKRAMRSAEYVWTRKLAVARLDADPCRGIVEADGD